jgi:hypothetical protein
MILEAVSWSTAPVLNPVTIEYSSDASTERVILLHLVEL